MRNILIVIRHEALNMLGRRSFWFMTFLFPAFIILVSFGSQLLAQNAFEESSSQGFSDLISGHTGPAIGYVDQAGIITQLPASIPNGLLQQYPDVAAAQAALNAGQLKQYYVIPADFVKTGKMELVDTKFSPFNTFTGKSIFEFIVNLNLAGNADLANAIQSPTYSVITKALGPQTGQSTDEAAKFFVPFAVMFVFFFVITMSSGFMLQSVTKEKENRTVEVLLMSVRPRELMLGKVIGLGLVALLQMAIWIGAGYGIAGQGGSLMGLAVGSITLPPGFVVWAVLYFLFGYLLYSSALGALGALAPNAREGAQFTFIFMLPLMIPLWLANTFIQTPNDGLSVFLSLFPLTAPTSMLTRLAAAGSVPFEQLLIGLIGLAITAYLFVMLSARFFRADTLLASGSLNLRRIVSAIRR